MDTLKQKQLIQYYSLYMSNILQIDILSYKCKKISEHINILTSVSYLHGPVLRRSNAMTESFNPFERYEIVKEFTNFNEFLIYNSFKSRLKSYS